MNWLVGPVLVGVILAMAATVFGIGPVWTMLWKTVTVVVVLSIFALGYCIWRENDTSTHQRYD